MDEIINNQATISKVTLKQIAEITGITQNTIRSRCKRESWPSCGTTIVNHNETKLYAIADLPVDIQQHFNSAYRWRRPWWSWRCNFRYWRRCRWPSLWCG